MKNNLFKFTIIFIITAIMFLPWLSSYFVTDTYNIMNLGYEDYTTQYWLKDGRVITALFGLLLCQINANIEIVVIISTILMILISTISVLYIANKVKKPATFLVLVFAYYTIVNFMYIDMVKFIEAPIMSTGVLLCIISASYLVNIARKRQYLLLLVLLLMSTLCYQGTIIVFAISTLLFAYLKEKDILKNIILAVAFSGIVLFINLLIVSNISTIIGIEQTRDGSIKNILSNIQYLPTVAYATLIDSCYVFPRYAFVLIMGALVTAVGLYSYKNNDYTALKIALITTAIAILAAFVFPLITLSSYDAGRMKLSIGMLVGIIYLLLYAKTDIFKQTTIFTKMLLAIFIIYAAMTTVSYIILINEQKNVNKYEKQQVAEIATYMEQYEQANNTKIKYIQKVYNVNHEKAKYPDTKFRTIDALKGDCSAIGAVNYYTNRNLQPIYKIKNAEEHLNSAQQEYTCIDDVLVITIRIV